MDENAVGPLHAMAIREVRDHQRAKFAVTTGADPQILTANEQKTAKILALRPC